jgi:hypothetical protein
MKEKLKSFYRFLSPRHSTVHLDHPVDPRPRYGHGLPPHPQLEKLIAAGRDTYSSYLAHAGALAGHMQRIRRSGEEADADAPQWNNGFLPGLDIVGIYTMLHQHRPARYIEVGSGNSTKVARRVITDHGLATEIVSIDPFPRASIDHLAHRVLRQRLEDLPDVQWIIDELGKDDILFIDNSHRVLPNSDATVFFLELLPRLKPGVIVHVHDIYLPHDYPQFMCDRFYSEQYLLAAFLLADPVRYRTLLPAWYISQDPELSALAAPLWDHPHLEGVERHGCSFWLRIGGGGWDGVPAAGEGLL